MLMSMHVFSVFTRAVIVGQDKNQRTLGVPSLENEASPITSLNKNTEAAFFGQGQGVASKV